MPCRDYSDDVRVVDNTQTYKAMRDKLARIACKAMTLLEERGVFLEDEEANAWFIQHKLDDARALATRKKLEKAEAERKRIHREQERQREVALLKKLQAKYGRTI